MPPAKISQFLDSSNKNSSLATQQPQAAELQQYCNSDTFSQENVANEGIIIAKHINVKFTPF